MRPAAVIAALWLLLAVLASPATRAQQTIDYAAWNAFADQVEQAVDVGAVSDEALGQLRARVVDWRAQFQQAQNARSTRVTTLQDQIAALGPAPAEGKTEPDDVAARRKTLQDELATEQAPALRAAEAYGRADGLVSAIDSASRSRQTTQVLALSPSPLLPSSWQAAWDDGARIARATGQELRADAARLAQRGRLTQALPGVLGLLALAALLLTVGRRWVDRLPGQLSRRASDYARGAVGFAASLAQIALPMAGVWLVLAAVRVSGLAGAWTEPMISGAVRASLTFFVGRWITRRLFPVDPARPALLEMTGARRDRARSMGTWLAAATALHQLIARPLLPLSGLNPLLAPANGVPQGFSEAGAGVVHLPLLLLGAVALYRLGHLLRRQRNTEARTGERLLAALGGVVRLAAIAAPLAAVAGYVSAANAMLWPTALTLGIVAVVVLLQHFISDLWRLVKRSPDGAQDALAPVLIGFGLALAALPVLALIWGARPSDLAEAWTRLAAGLRVGSVRISPGAVLTFLVVFGIGYSITRAVQGTLRSSILPRTRLEKGAQTALVSGLGYLGIFIAAVIAITAAGIDLSSLAIVAGALSVGIGFGLQNIVSNFVSGIILLIERPVTVGDWVRVGSAEGYVRRISVRSTVIQTFDRTEVIVPNGDLITQQVTNWTRGSLTGRITIPVSVASGSDTRHVADILLAIAEDQPTVLIDPAPVIAFTGFGADGLDFEVRALLSDINQGIAVSTAIRHEIVARFAAEKIAMPFAQRDVWLRNPEVLTGAGRAGAAAVGAAPAQPAAPAAPAPATTAHKGAAPAGTGDLDPRIAHASSSGVEDMGDADGEGDGNR